MSRKRSKAVEAPEMEAPHIRRNGQETNLPIDKPLVTPAIPATCGEMAQKSAPVPLPEAAMTAAAIQQAKQALGLLSSFADAAEKPSSVREKSGPRVQIGTIEVIVESAPAVQQKPSPFTGFTRDPGRYYQRRL
ncbi:MAG: hypothetical protein FWF12_03975 [Betaproteobacteria bacterium]|nr:hypothetical protein [Betaproteobacteria bacterium]